jgi:acetyl-CoA synthetase
MSNDYDFIPEKENFEKSNIYKFMSKFQIYNYRDFYNKSISEIEWFWEQVSQDIGIIWDKKYSKILDSSMGIPHSKWFIDGKTNIYKSSVEKFAKINPEKIAYHFLSENKKNSSITFSDLEKKSNQIASHLKKIGIKKGDVIGIFLPMIEEAIISILACAKIGVIQTVIFSGYSSDSLHIRLKDCNAKILIASDGFFRKGKPISQKKIIENAIRDTKIEKTIIVRYQKIDEYVENEKILFFDSLINEKIDVVETEIMDSEDPLFILYTSGTTGKPKGVIQPHGGFSVFAGHQSSYLIDMNSNDILFWPADIGWITGLVWNVYGLLLIGGTSIIYDGALDYPDNDHIWELIEKYNVTIFGISPTAVRTFKKNGVNPREKFNLDKIKNIPTTGEPIDKDSWNWLFEKNWK